MKNFFSWEDEKKNRDQYWNDTLDFINVINRPWKKREFPDIYDAFSGKTKEEPKDKGFFNW